MTIWQGNVGTSVCVCVYVCAFDAWCWFSLLLSHVCPCRSVFLTACICCTLLMCMCILCWCVWVCIWVGPWMCLRTCPCACQGVEGSVRPPDGEYHSYPAPSLINFFPDWLRWLINKTWSGDQMQISLSGWGGGLLIAFSNLFISCPAALNSGLEGKTVVGLVSANTS